MANINENKEAYQMMKNALGSIENRFREAYNKGYKDGLKEGINQTTKKLVNKILDEVETDTPQTETSTNSEKVQPTVEVSQTDWKDQMYTEAVQTDDCTDCTQQADCPWK